MASSTIRPDFTHFDYVDPDAPKGGSLVDGGDRQLRQPQSVSSSRASPAVGLGLVFETLTTQSHDEPFTEYGLLAESIDDAGGSLLGRVRAAAARRAGMTASR